MSLLKYSSKLILRELDQTKKKMKVLEDSYVAGNISKLNYEHMEKGLAEALIDLEAHVRGLAKKMEKRADELEDQMRSLEMVLAKLEIRYAAGEVDAGTYIDQNRAIIIGLNATNLELDTIRDSLSITYLNTQNSEASETHAYEEKTPDKPHWEASHPQESMESETKFLAAGRKPPFQPTIKDISKSTEQARELERVRIDENLAKKVLSKTPSEKAFHFYSGIDQPTGISADSLINFCEKIKTMDMKPIEFHVSRGDIELWVGSLGDIELARRLRMVRETNSIGEDLRKKLCTILEIRCHELMTEELS